ncbi:MAG: hypothetical protein AAF318_19635 [Pseudomonadota bacterium]
MDISKSQVQATVESLFSERQYETLSRSLGGPYLASEAIWAAMNAVYGASLQTLGNVIETALAVPFWLANTLSDFVSDLVDVFRVLGEEVPEIANGAAQGVGVGARAAGTIVTGAVSRATRGTGPYGTAVGSAAAVAGASVVAGGVGMAVGGGLIVGSAIGGAVATASARGTGGRLSNTMRSSRTARRLRV